MSTLLVIDDTEFAGSSNRLFGEADGAFQPSFFSLPEWFQLVARHGLEQGWRARLFAGEDGRAGLVCAVPANGMADEIRGCCNVYSCEYGFLGDNGREDSPRAIRELMAAVARENSRTHAILLPGLDPADPSFAAAMSGLKDSGFLVKPYFCWGTWFEPAAGRDFNDYLATRPSVLKNTWRRKLASLEKESRVTFRNEDDIGVGGFIGLYDDVYRRSWKVPEPFPDFMPALMRMAAGKGALRFGILEAGGQAVAAQFWIVWQGRAIIYKLAYDEKWSKFSPGTLLTMHMLRHVLERDHPVEINFGRGDDGYKNLWMSERRERWGIEAANPRTARGLGRAVRLSAARMRDYFLRRG